MNREYYLDDDILVDDDFQNDNVLGGRVYGDNYQDQLNNIISEYGDDAVANLGKPINVYQFRKTSGIIRITNDGERNLFYSNSLFRQTTNIYTGKSPIVVVWNNSTNVYVNERDNLIKELKVGTYFQCYSEQANSNDLVVETINILGKEYVNSYINREINLFSKDWEPSDDDILEYVYLILDPVNNSLQWLEITNTKPYYNEMTKELERCEITFANVNLKYSHSGKTLIDFIQLGAIGEGYAFPIETKDDEGNIIVGLDESKKLRNNDGTTQIQFDFNSGVGNSSFLFWGREKEFINENGLIEIPKTKILFPYHMNFPKTSEFFYNRPNMNSYYGINLLPTKQEIWNSYKEAYKQNNRVGEYNIDKEKEVLVGFKVSSGNTTNIESSNPSMSTYINWDNKKSVNLVLNNLDLKPIPFIKNDVNFINSYFTYGEFFTINAFLNWYTDVFNFDYRETTKYKLSDTLGILGSILDILVGGLDIGFTRSSSLGKSQPINFLMPCISFQDGMSALSDVAPIPSDIFIDSNVKKVLPTATNVLTSWNFSLTDRFRDTSMVVNNAPIGKGGLGIWDTKYLGQSQDENGNWLLETHKPILINLNTFSLVGPSTTNGFIIDYLDFKAVGICDYRISAYNKNNENTYSVYLETNSKARDEITLWGNSMKFNYYEEFNTIGQAKWPMKVLPPKPRDRDIYQIIDEYQNLEIMNIQDDFYVPSFSNGWNGTLTNRKVYDVDYGVVPGGVVYSVLLDFQRELSSDKIVRNNDYVFTKSFQANINEFNINEYDRLYIEFNNQQSISIPLEFDRDIEIIQRPIIITQKEEYAMWLKNTSFLSEFFSDANSKLLQLKSTLSSIKVRLHLDLNYQLTMTIKTTLSNNTLTLENSSLARANNYRSSGQSPYTLDDNNLKNVFSNFRISFVGLLPK